MVSIQEQQSWIWENNYGNSFGHIVTIIFTSFNFFIQLLFVELGSGILNCDTIVFYPRSVCCKEEVRKIKLILVMQEMDKMVVKFVSANNHKMIK
jgi:hypothetical protein